MFFSVRMVPVSFVGYSKRVPRRVPEMLTLSYFFVQSLFALYALKSLVFRRSGVKKGLPDFSENPDRGASRVRTGDPLLAFSENPWESKIMHESSKG